MSDPEAPTGGRSPRLRSRVGAAAFLAGALIAGGTWVSMIIDDGSEETAPTTTSTTASTTTTAPRALPPTTLVSRSVVGPESPPDCGAGSAVATPDPPDHPGGNRWPTRAGVVSDFDRPIEVTRLAVRITFANGASRDTDLHTAGVVVPPGEQRLVSGPTVESGSPPVRWQAVAFSFQTEGRPDCAVSG